jgi:trehalose synthase
VVQVSRWDQLKDMSGVMQGFAEYVAPEGNGYPVLAGPAVAGVTDDPEGAAVFGDCLLQWRDLPAAVRARVLLVTLPLVTPAKTPPWLTHCSGTPPLSRKRASPRGSD